MVKQENESSTVSTLTSLLQNRATPVVVNVALFIAGVAFIKSPLMDNLAPQL
ncbi:mitochondrial import receptor subunit Tom6p [Trichomonascus vanleenenianus]|uniref:Tom6p n=1 Tax=Trichomonascus vanleenenianus TaxID=2268995 RepID=UPI003ECB01F1